MAENTLSGVVGNALSDRLSWANTLMAVRKPRDGDPRKLEFWPSDEAGTSEYPRPNDIPLGRAGVEIISDDVRPQDVVGDVVSHYGVENDPRLVGYYARFSNSMNIDQQKRLVDQYGWYRANAGENRPYPEWEQKSGLPAYFRGYAFNQWDNPDPLYTGEQRAMFDAMNSYLRTGK